MWLKENVKQRSLTTGMAIAAMLLVPVTAYSVPASMPLQDPPNAEDWSPVGLGTKLTLLVVLSPDCASCEAGFGFYKELLRLPIMDGTAGRIVVVARGVGPMSDILKAHSFKPHRLTSGPAFARSIEVPSAILLDRTGKRTGTWRGLLDPSKQKAVRAAVGALASKLVP